MPDAAAVQATIAQFMDYLRTRMFGLVAFVDRPGPDEVFPIASGVIIESEGQYVLLTAAHFLRDMNRWKEQERLNDSRYHRIEGYDGICPTRGRLCR